MPLTAESLLAALAAWTLTIPFRFEAVLLSPTQLCLYHLPVAVTAALALRFRHSLLGVATLLATSAVVVLRLLGLPMFQRLWLATGSGVPAFLASWSISLTAGVLIAALTPAGFRQRLRPFSLAAGVALAWWLRHTFTDYSYYLHGATFAAFASLLAPLLLLLALPTLQSRGRLGKVATITEPLLVVVLGWLASLPLYPVHGVHMRLADLRQFLYTVAAPAVIGAALFSSYTAWRGHKPCA